MEAIRELIAKLRNRGEIPEGERSGTYKAVKKLKDERGLSPVIATVIIVAVTITVAVAVAYWMSGIASQYTAFEKVEIQSAVITHPAGCWQVVIILKNSGTKTATLTNVFVNDGEAGYAATIAGWSAGIAADVGPASTQTKQILSGATDDVTVWIDDTGTLTSGTTVNIKIHSAGGMDYIRLVQLT